MQKKLVGMLPSAVAVAAGLVICAGCQSQEVLADRNYQTSPDSEVALPVEAPVDLGAAPAPVETATLEVEEQVDVVAQPVIEPAPIKTAPAKPKYKPFVGKKTGPSAASVKSYAPGSTSAPKSTAKAGDLSYTVKKNDTLSGIAFRHGVKTRDLAAVNNIAVSSTLKIGQKLAIPAGGKAVKSAPATGARKSASAPAETTAVKSSAAKAERPADGVYVVQKNDALWLIARRFDTTVKNLCELNNIPADKPLQLGQKIKLPGASATVTAPAATATTATSAPSATVTTPDTPVVNPVVAVTPATATAAGTGTVAPTATLEPAATGTATTPEVTSPTTPDLEVSTNTMMLEQDTTLQNFCRTYRWAEDEIRRLNPELPADGVLKKNQTLIVPAL